MRIRLCPYCDSEMKKAHHCDVCNSFVWRPEYEDIHLNAESRGLGEEDCAYGEVHDEKDHAAGKIKNKRAKTEYATYTQGNISTARQKDASDKKRSGSGKGIISLIVVIVIIADAFISVAGDDINPEDFLEDIFQDDLGDDSVEYLDDDQVSERTEACTDFNHLTMTKDQIEDIIEDWHNDNYADYDLEIEEDSYSNNYVQYGSDLDDYHLEQEDDLYIYMSEHVISFEVNYDSATGQVHYISVYDLGTEDAQQLLDRFIAEMDDLYGEDEGQISLQDTLADTDDADEYEIEQSLNHVSVEISGSGDTIEYMTLCAKYS